MVQTFLDHLTVERGRAANTLAAYRRDLRRYRDWLGEHGLGEWEAITPAHLGEYLAALTTGDENPRPLAPRSVARAASAVRGLHRFAVAEGHTAHDPTVDATVVRPKLRLPKAVDLETVNRLLEAAAVTGPPRGTRDVALLEFLYGTGARVSEAVGLDVDDVDVDQSSVFVTGKGGRSRVLPLGGYALRALQRYAAVRSSLKPTGPQLFVNQRGGRLTRQGAHLILSGCAEVAGLPPGIGPHTLRHSFATHLLDGGADIRVVQELLGHVAVSTTQIYTLVTVDKLREVYATSHPRAR